MSSATPVDKPLDTVNNSGLTKESKDSWESQVDLYVSNQTYMCFSTNNPSEKKPKTQEDALKCQ